VRLLSFVSKGEEYISGFWFQKLDDALKFYEKHGGTASWHSTFENKRKEMTISMWCEI